MLTQDQSTQLLLLADYVKKNKRTQQELSLATGVHQSQVSEFSEGMRGDHLRTCSNYANMQKH
jgi:hypothetical protein